MDFGEPGANLRCIHCFIHRSLIRLQESCQVELGSNKCDWDPGVLTKFFAIGRACDELLVSSHSLRERVTIGCIVTEDDTMEVAIFLVTNS